MSERILRRRFSCRLPSQLICRACLQHPHHTLFIILALVNADRDTAFCAAPGSKGVPWQSSPLDLVRTGGWCTRRGGTLAASGSLKGLSLPVLQERSDRARTIIAAVRQERGELVKGMERLCEAYIALAYMDAGRHKTEKSERRRSLGGRAGWGGRGRAGLIFCLASRAHSHPCRPAHPADPRPGGGAHPHPGAEGERPAARLLPVRADSLQIRLNQVDPSGRYDDLVTVRSFLPHYQLVGGVNLPKIIDCVGSDGKSRRQLVKVGGLLSSSGSHQHPPAPPLVLSSFSSDGLLLRGRTTCVRMR